MTPVTVSPWLTSEQAVQYLQVGSLSALYRLIHTRRLPFGRVGKAYRFLPAQLDAWVLRNQQPLKLAREA